MTLDGKLNQLKGNIEEKIGEATDHLEMKNKGQDNKIATQIQNLIK